MPFCPWNVVSAPRGDNRVTFLVVQALLLLVADGAHAAPDFVFTDITASVGISHSRAVALPEACNGGVNCALSWAGTVAAEDMDGDGDVDLYFTLDAGPGVLYQNQGGTFVDVTTQAGLGAAPVGGGVALVDIDGDGDRDLLINPISTTTVPASHPFLYLSDASTKAAGGVPVFAEVAVARGLVAPRRNAISGMGIAVGDYDLDGALDVYFADWRDRVVVCDAAGARLFRGVRGAPGYFADATLSAGVWAREIAGAVRGYSFGGAFSDLDRDGLPDLLVTSDAESSELYWGRTDGTFEAGGGAAGIATERTGMGSTLADYDNDGDLDLFVSAILSDQNNWDGNRLYRYDGARTFSDQTDAAGLRDVGWAWGAVFADLDNDGDVDLSVTAGTAASSAALAGYADNETKVFLNPGSASPWEDVSDAVGVRSLRLGREIIALDYDGDGDQDLLMVPHVGPPALLRNDPLGAKDWLDVRVLGVAPALEAIGAFIEARGSDGSVQVREVGTRAHFTGHGPRVEHFGFGPGFFGAGGTVELRVTFPDGGALVRMNMTTSGLVTLSRAEASVATRAALPIPPARDCDADNYPDRCQLDCDGNSEPDACQLLAHPEQDCDADRLIDTCAIDLGFVADCDGDRVPDGCQVAPVCVGVDAGLPDIGAGDSGVGRDQGAGDAGALSDASHDLASHDQDTSRDHGADHGLGADDTGALDEGAPPRDDAASPSPDSGRRPHGSVGGGSACALAFNRGPPPPLGSSGALALSAVLLFGRVRRRRARQRGARRGEAAERHSVRLRAPRL